MLFIATLIAIIGYAGATWLQWQRLSSPDSGQRNLIRVLGLGAFAIHGYAVYKVLHYPEGIDLGTFPVGSFIAWVVVGILLVSSLRQKLDNLFIGAFPMAAITAALAAFGPDTGDHRLYPGGLVAHILLSLLAYSIFTLAALQALLLSRQELSLKHHQTRGLVASLPPLQVMERLLFEMLWCGFVLLTVSLVTGFIFVEDLFAQHLVHKTLLSIVAWLVYAILLAGRVLLGWRSQTAVRWTLGGFLLLMLAFFGSKIVIELVFHGQPPAP
ncbi:cytochrome c biogenesis protein CcsA [Marinobacterium sp. D7]|uniref:cytochrome C assembly family protein n=1 Tax=Marinobacterium ramblicola TaxID=2849041 RepID=UPI001C2D282A|nr:cytochrome c biogenesis protein CcsA [Marinobacterium ramblicola]MBV1788968.1 cytochrome c biogenesis protein CcsA [Marinobacterium ramblicola]